MSARVEHIHEAVGRVLAARESVLATHSTQAVIEAIAAAAKNWLVADSPWRERAVEEAPAVTGFSPAMVGEIVERVFGAVTTESLRLVLEREFGNWRVLDEFSAHGATRTRAFGPPLILHWLAGNVPAPGILSVINGLLLRSGNLVRMSARDTVFPRLFVESVRAVAPEVGACAEVWEWPHTDRVLSGAVLARADAVVAFGEDSAIAAVRQMTPSSVTFLGYGQKVSFAYVCRDALTPDRVPVLAAAVAEDVSVYDQQGCLSPHVIYVEEGGVVSAREFAAALADAMAVFQARIPAGTLSLEEAAMVSILRAGYEFRAASDAGVAVWADAPPHRWLVIYDDDPAFVLSCLNRTVFVKPAEGERCVLAAIRQIASRISTVGVAPMSDRMLGFAEQLARLGIHRVCPVGQMQRPPLWWFHDGRPNLSLLVRWTDLD
ncbi:MAG: hypothetical protein N3B01_06880 [Verrucomicrobiae bacterium]|nr:hypothetical protein [Verrucomicrobiae bacterium]